MGIKGVKIGDHFRPNNSKHIVAEVVDILECKSLKTGEVTGYMCIARNITGLATNTFEVSFTSVKRFKVG
jgi:hypothetical protein